MVGISDEGSLLGCSEEWARQTEQSISQHVNDKLTPSQSCVAITCHEVNGSWLVLVKVHNPGDVVYWDDRAYRRCRNDNRGVEPYRCDEIKDSTSGADRFLATTVASNCRSSLVP